MTPHEVQNHALFIGHLSRLLLEEAERSQGLMENNMSQQTTNVTLLEKLSRAEAELETTQADLAAARGEVATLTEQLTAAGSRINELEATAVTCATTDTTTRKKWEAPEYPPLPEGCKIGEGYRQLAYGEKVLAGDEIYIPFTERWEPAVDINYIYVKNSNLLFRRKDD